MKAHTSSIINFKHIPGLTLYHNFITLEEEVQLLSSIDDQPWSNELKRRVQHYGWKYDYSKRSLDNNMKLGDLPPFCASLVDACIQQRILSAHPDQLIINEYTPGQGISPHIDQVKWFGNEIVSVSLGSDILMDFKHKMSHKQYSILLPRRSLVLLSGEARYNWTHGIVARKRDKIDGQWVARERRVSLTFRKVIQLQEKGLLEEEKA